MLSPRLFALMTVALAGQGALYFEIAGISGTAVPVGIGWFALTGVLAVLTARRTEVRIGSVTLSRSQVAGLADIALGLGWLTVGVGLWLTLSAPNSPAEVYEWLWVFFVVFGLWSGARMLQGHERYRLLEPGETTRSRREQVGWAEAPLGVLKEEAMRSIGVFGMFVLPTFVIALVVPSVSLGAPITYLPAACLAIVIVAGIAWLRVRTGAGPMPGQLREAVGELRAK